MLPVDVVNAPMSVEDGQSDIEPKQVLLLTRQAREDGLLDGMP